MREVDVDGVVNRESEEAELADWAAGAVDAEPPPDVEAAGGLDIVVRNCQRL
jgi:hypothetical protein